ncbi:carbonic anhydrase, partial [Paremcibacter congregatus]|uniref:carbonic anhydrase n=1 Tax=Paremcibacter congregatus TaxID=2043170 RepID=UPI003A93D3DC
SNDPSVPEILWIGCSEALLLPHQLLNLSRGQILVHRNFGNCAPTHDLNFLSVLEFALETLNIRHIIVAGHHDCRAVKTVLADNTTGLLHHWLAPMNEMFVLRRKEVSAMIRPKDQESFLATLHTGYQVRNLADNPAVRRYWASGHELGIHGWVYHDGTDKIYDLGVSLTSPQ